MTRWLSIVGVGLALSSLTLPCRAEPPDVAARLAFLERVIEREQDRTRLWYDTWLGFFAAATLAQGGVVLATTAHQPRIAMGVGMAKSAIATGFMLIGPRRGRVAADSLRALPPKTSTLERLRAAESILRVIAAEERARQSWFPAIGGAALNVAGAWTVWALGRNSTPGWLGLVSGTAISLVHRFTQPTGAIRALEAYERGDLRAPKASPRASIAPSPTGIVIQGSF